jgi:hypothetical protein
MLAENPFLDVSRREVVVVVKPNFTDRNHFRVPTELLDLHHRTFIGVPGVVRVEPHASVNGFISPCEFNGPTAVIEIRAGNHDEPNVCGLRPLENFFPIGIEVLCSEMCVSVDEQSISDQWSVVRE